MNKNINFSFINIDKFIDEYMMFKDDEELLNLIFFIDFYQIL